MNELLESALVYAQRGWHVFPVHGIVSGACTCGRDDCSSPGKHPLVKRGVHDATIDERAINEWWRRWRGANVAVATGTSSGVIVVDIDVPRGDSSLEVLEAIGRGLPVTLAARTGSGGRHLYYRAPDHRLGNPVGGLPGIEEELPGMDLRAEGGYVLAPPSDHISGARYEWIDPSVPMAQVPSWLKGCEREPVAQPPAPAIDGPGSAYGLAVLQGELDRIRTAPKGRRNHTLNRAAFAVARVVAGGELLEIEAHAALLAGALRIGLTEHESRMTIASALAAGKRRPRSAPHRLRGCA